MHPSNTSPNGSKATLIYLGIAAGTAVAIAVALTQRGHHRKRRRWESAKEITRNLADHSQDLAAKSKNLIERVQTIYEEGRKVVEEATEIWSHGRRLVGV